MLIYSIVQVFDLIPVFAKNFRYLKMLLSIL